MVNRNFKNNIFLITYAAILIAIFIRVDNVMQFARKIITVMMPFIYGITLAYVINWPYDFLMNKINIPKVKLKKIVSLILSYTLAAGAVTFLFYIIVPQVSASIRTLINMSTSYYPQFEQWIEGLPNSNSIQQILEKFSSKFDLYWESAFTSVFAFTKDFAISLYNWIIGFIISIYLLSSKEKLIHLIKRISSAYLPKSLNQGLLEVSSLLHNVFGNFIKGKILDSFIIGVLCFAGMTIFRMPFAVLISVIVGFTNVIPFFGPFFGAIPSIIIIYVADPQKAFWFALFILFLQQLDGNVIGPKILGESVGLPGIFIIFSVLLGGGIFGVPGMILGVPIFAVIYVFVGRFVKKKEETFN